ncbi:MAG: hypothetical protein IJB45_03330 [Clostridia bacterium]|nr:hypothetical protein [Clostridia bacterium]
MVFMTLFTAFGIALLTIIAPFIGFFDILTGGHYEDVVLPYAPEKGLVWEYDNVDDPYIKLEKMTVKGDEQIFRFVSAGLDPDSFDYYNGECMDLVFTAENGETQTYYSFLADVSEYSHIWVEHEDNCITYEFTVTRDEAYADLDWELSFYCPNKRNVLYFADGKGTEKTFKLVYFKSTPIHDGIAEAYLYFEDDDPEYKESYSVEVDFSSGEAVVIREDSFVYDYSKPTPAG